jgi:capsular exopolysaccharide synthesis family protein
MSDSLQRPNNNGIQNGFRNFEFIPNSFERKEDGNNGLDPKKIIALIMRYKWIIMLFVIAGATGAWFYADSLPPTYESKGTVLINSADASTDKGLSQIIAKTTGYGTNSTLENELQILQSKKFAHQVASKLIQETPGGIKEFPVLWNLNEETGDVFKAEENTVASRIRGNLSFRKLEEKADVIEISFQSSSPEEAVKVVNEAMQIYVENSTQQNRQAASSTADFLEKEKQKIKEKLEDSEEKLRRYMDNTGMVKIDEQASGMVSQRVDTEAELQRVNLDLKTVEQTISNYENQLEKIRPGLTEQFSQAIGPRIRNLQDELAGYENERMQIIAKNPDVLNRETTPPRLKFIDDQVSRLKKEIKDLSAKLFTEDEEFVGMNGEAQAQMVSNIQTRLIELRIQQNQYRARRDALLTQKEQMDADFNTLPKGMMELAKLERDVRINEELYLNLSRQYADMSVWEQSQFGFGRIIDLGERPRIPVSPNKKILLLLGIMLGGVLSAGFIIVREFNDDSVKSVVQLRTHLPSLMFSAIPTFEKVSEKDRKPFVVGHGKIPDEMVLLQDPTSIASESIRRLKNNIIYQWGVVPPKTIAVTSPEKGDGKSTIVANLGVAFAEEGYKTLIVGADFRRPKLQKYFGLNAQDGLFEYMNGELSFQELLMSIQNSELKSLKIITSGDKGSERPELIGNSKVFKQFLKKMEEVFDVILLDTPPFGIISDSTALLKDAEACLVVARHRKTNSSMLLRTIEELGRIQANVTGIVLNDFNHKKEPYSVGYYETMYGNYKAYVK